MQLGQDEQHYRTIATILKDVMPPDAAWIAADATVGDDWSEVRFAYGGADGNPRHFSIDEHPATAAGDIGDVLLDMRERLQQDGGDVWSGCRFTLQRDGRFSLDFSFDEADA